jgi:hypothetical protein
MNATSAAVEWILIMQNHMLTAMIGGGRSAHLSPRMASWTARHYGQFNDLPPRNDLDYVRASRLLSATEASDRMPLLLAVGRISS